MRLFRIDVREQKLAASLIVAITLALALSVTTFGDPLTDSCTTPGADDWPTWSHDYQHTGASNIPVGDPNGITLAWSLPLPYASNFTNPTIAYGVVYISSNAELSGFDLTTSLPIPGSPFSGIPEIGWFNRGNTTIHKDIVYVTGGNFAALSALPAGDLRKSSIYWSNNAMTMGDMSQQNRFGCAMVIDDLEPGVDVVFVLTEPIQDPGLQGELYAFDAANGMLYSGWGANPVLFDKAARHGPTYDGTWLYVGTGDADLTDGSIYAVDPHTGAIKWQFRDDTYDPLNPGGFPGGVSIEGNYLYATSADDQDNGRRFKIDKSGSTPVVIWMQPQSRTFYSTPTIGRDHLYVPQDNAPGVLVVDKGTGDVVHNFAADGVVEVPQNIALSCDSYLFVSDRLARWWVLNANTFETEFYRQYPVPGVGIVNGTALATDTSGNHYAVVGIRWDGTSGRVSAYRLGAGPRPRLQQNAFTTLIEVPMESGPGLTYAVPDVFTSIGDQDVTFESFTIGDPNPDPILKLESTARQRLDNSPYSSIPVGADYWTHFSTDRITKSMRLAGIGGPMTQDGEFTQYEYDRFIKPLEEAQATSGRARIRAAAATGLVRTSNVTIGGSALPVMLPPGTTADLAWEYDGTDLGRGTDVEIIRLTVNDPDFDYDIGSSVAEFEITYRGGCTVAYSTLLFNASSPDAPGHHLDHVTNYGAYPYLSTAASVLPLVWSDDPADSLPLYDGSLMLVGDSLPEGIQFFAYNSIVCASAGRFIPNVAPGTGTCGFDRAENIRLGSCRGGGIPGFQEEIFGEYLRASYSDTNERYPPESPLAAIGVDITQTEVGAYDPRYGDFTLIRWELTNRGDSPKGPLYAGTWMDWDVGLGYDGYYNKGMLSDNFAGYCIWNPATPTNAYGMLIPEQPSCYRLTDPTPARPHSITIMELGYCLGIDYWRTYWHLLINQQPLRHNDAADHATDAGAFLLNQSFDLEPYGTHAIHQALFAVDAALGNIDQIETNAVELAARAARWGGFARGDVNDDGFVDLGDVLWLVLGYPIYPDDYCGDVNIDGVVDQTDIDQLMAWVSGDPTAQPLGEWRFAF